MQEDVLAIVAEHNEGDEDESADIETLGPSLDNDLLARVVTGEWVAWRPRLDNTGRGGGGRRGRHGYGPG